VPIKQTDLEEVIRQIKNLIPAVIDLLKQLTKYLPVSLSVLERHNRAYEELDSVRLEIEVLKEIQRENTFESSRWANQLSKDMHRLEEWIILARIGKEDSPKAGEITQEVSREHIERSLSEQLTEQQKLLQTYQRNLARVQQSIAEMGYETIENMNKREDFERKIQRINEAIGRIRDALK
jgi:hypothetical protein